MIVRGSWPFDGGGGHGRDPRQALVPLAFALAIVWVAAILTVLVVLALKLFV